MEKIIIDKNSIMWALETAEKKACNTFDSWKKRTIEQRFLDIFIGDLAKCIVKRELISRFPKIVDYLTEYDLVRRDNFKNNDEFDLKVLNIYNIEIKSSFEKYSTDLNIINNSRNIIVNKNNCHENQSDFIFQVIYIHSDLNWFKKISNGTKKFKNILELKNEIIDNIKNIDIYIAGFVNKVDVLMLHDTFVVDGASNNDKKREYLKFKISETKGIDSFRDDLFFYHKRCVNNRIIKNKSKIKRKK